MEALTVILSCPISTSPLSASFPETTSGETSLALILLLLLQDDDADTIREAFKIFDRDKDGFISTKELKKVTIAENPFSGGCGPHGQALTRCQKSEIEKRKRNMESISQISRREKRNVEICFLVREENENFCKK